MSGAIIGASTVSNKGCKEVGSACLAERRAIEMTDHGESHTPFLRFGDRLRFEVKGDVGSSTFGAIDHRYVPVGAGAQEGIA